MKHFAGVALIASVVAVVAAFGYESPVGIQNKPRLTLGRPVQIGTIAVIPIESTAPLSKDKYYTLSQAEKLGLVKIIEVPGGGRVNSLELHNLGDLPILLFAGELLLGGQQDRIVAKDTIVPAHEGRDVPVFCVEHGRWNGSPEFKPADTFVPDKVRSAGNFSQSQSEVWAKVADVNSMAAVSPSTGTIRGTIFDSRVRGGADRLYAQLLAKFAKSPNTVGAMCWINGRIHSADIFANSHIFDGSYTKLLKSYALDVQLESRPASTAVNMAACRKFLADILSAKRDAGELTAGGRVFQLSNGKVQGYESGSGGFGGGVGGGSAGYSHGTYKPGGG